MYSKAIKDDALMMNLEDAGCDCVLAQQCIALKDDGKTQDMLRLLSGQRKQLLHNLHKAQKEIDCLDYLIYTMKKALNEKGENNK